MRIESLESRIVPAGVHFAETVGEIDGYKFGPSDDFFGQSMASGDFNGDGFLDLLVGAPGGRHSGPITSGQGDGSAYVFFGDGADFEFTTPAALNGANGFRIHSDQSVADLGFGVEAADINGDGIDDMIVGAPLADSYQGAVYVIFGKETSFGPSFDVGSLDGTNGFKIAASPQVIMGIGGSIDSGDFNGDGYDDILTANIIFFGHAGTFAAWTSIANLDGTNGTIFPFNSAPYTSKTSPISVGDINGDGYDDLAITTSKYVVWDSEFGSVFEHSTGGAILYGKPTWTAQTESIQTDGVHGVAVVLADPESGHASLRAAGDINGDGFDDFLVGYDSTGFSLNPVSTVRVVYGGANLGPEVNLSELDGTNGFSLLDPSKQLLGSSVAAVGDFNGDGIDDIGMRGLEYGANSFAYMLYGTTEQRSSEVILGELLQKDGVKFFTTDHPGQYWVGPVATVPFALGDLNNDGKDDFAIVDWDSSFEAEINGVDWQTTVFLVNGQDAPANPSVVTISANGKSATYTDVDGDKITISTNRGNLNDADFTFARDGLGWKLIELDLGDEAWTALGIDLRINALAKGGDGFVDVGSIDATGIDLRTVTVDGNLQSIFAGDSDLTTTAIKTLKVKSMDAGSFETPITSKIDGALLKLVIRDFAGGVDLTATAIGAVDIGGVLHAQKTSFVSNTTIESVKIRGDAANLLIRAKDAEHVSSIYGPRAIGRVQFGGDASIVTIDAGEDHIAYIDRIKVKGAWTNGLISGYVDHESGVTT